MSRTWLTANQIRLPTEARSRCAWDNLRVVRHIGRELGAFQAGVAAPRRRPVLTSPGSMAPASST